MISMICDVCKHCGKLIEYCEYQRMMRAFDLVQFAEDMTEEREFGACTTTQPSKSHTPYGKMD